MVRWRIVFLVSVIIFLVTMLCGEVVAILGPVHVELNTFGEMEGPTRANTITSFKIYLRINEDLHFGDWLKVWFPVEEASKKRNDICYPVFESDSSTTSREITEETFYKVLDSETGLTEFYNISGCDDMDTGGVNSSGKNNYLYGTVFPSLPRDEEERKEKLMRIDHSTALGYSPCGDCGQGYPIITQTCEERSYQFNCTFHLETWRQGYNPIDINTSYYTGILAPATPGRYKIRVATEPEPTPVESDAFFLPCSSITKPELHLIEHRSTKYYAVNFSTGEGGALDSRHSTINISFPDGFEFWNVDIAKRITVNGIACEEVDRAGHDGVQVLSINSPINVNNMGMVSVLLKRSVFKRTLEDQFSVMVNTSSEPETVESFTLKEARNDSSLIRNIELSSYRTGDIADIAFNLDSRHLPVHKYTEFRIILPETARLPTALQNGQFLINGYPVERLHRWSGNEISLWMNTNHLIDYYSLRSISFHLTESAGIVNPTRRGLKRLSMKVGGRRPIKSKYFYIH